LRVRNSILALTGILAVGTVAILMSAHPALSSSQQGEQQQPTQQTTPPPPTQQPGLQTQAPPSGPIIVLDPAHGGTDTGARGENGLAEKDVVLQIARAVREQLAQKGYRAFLTRNDDSNPSYDDRAGQANAYREAIFISLHISSTGAPGTARAYFDQFSAPIPAQPTTGAAPGAKSAAPAPQSTLVAWHDAQRSYVEASHHLADLLQLQLAQAFPGSPTASTGAAVRALRSVAGPAVAIEISSVASPADALTGSAAPLAAAISNALGTLRQGAK
jgi:N-acetylmuramoyl-L-alanine amidase